MEITPLVGSPLGPLVTSSKNPIEEIAVCFLTAKSPKEKNKISKIEKEKKLTMDSKAKQMILSALCKHFSLDPVSIEEDDISKASAFL